MAVCPYQLGISLLTTLRKKGTTDREQAYFALRRFVSKLVISDACAPAATAQTHQRQGYRKRSALL